jgi:hypothetical protein
VSRQTADIDAAAGVRFQCDYCRKVDRVAYPALGTYDDAARVLGYRLTSTAPDATVICPQCAGTDETYWRDREPELALRRFKVAVARARDGAS